MREMKPKPSVKLLLAYVYSLAWFALTALFGMSGPGDFSDATNTLQKLCSVVVTGYGVFGVLGIVGLLAKRRWTREVVVVWGALLIAAAVLAPAAWAPGELRWWTIALGALLAAVIAGSVYLIVDRLVRARGSIGGVQDEQDA